MRAHLEALAAYLAPLEYRVHLLYAEGATPGVTADVPFLVVGSGMGWRPDEMSACDRTEGLDTTVQITCTASTVLGALTVMDAVRNYLSPELSWTSVPMVGRAVNIRHLRDEQVGANGATATVDRDLRLPDSNRHPGYGVQAYQLVSTPAPIPIPTP